MKPTAGTFLDLFFDLCSRPNSAEKDIVSCAGETWTYGDLHVISASVASTIGNQYGPRPTVALISENHPYVIVLLLAVWKLGGIVAPLDCHAPADLMEAMLQNIAPSFIVASLPDIVHNLDIPIELIEPETYTITALAQRFLHLSHIVPTDFCILPQPDDVCLYIHTSSASSVSNLKCVPVTHHSLVMNGRSQLAWFQRNLPGVSLEYLRVLGWSLFSHIMSICFDLGTSVLMTGGCYIFALMPSMYSIATRSEVEGQFDVPTLLLDAILKHQPDAFAAVPWVLDGLMHAWNAEIDLLRRSRIDTALQNLKYFISAGAATNEEGMTELGGVLFHSLLSEAASGWRNEDSCIDDAIFTLIDENGDTADTGFVDI
ncbi:hypothetical protein Hypma_000136 [Hypsizygus marmoreus]|uniref:AMP-dependent synthetase/ligase domain-containing protein n=1 Tax=Hypsizygus marmoreus TaxID=39966 RepID=A0A369K8P6_HYPMA|nr:hypothetical protein Hypma_000136 [Hypsizygus marmoreus]